MEVEQPSRPFQLTERLARNKKTRLSNWHCTCISTQRGTVSARTSREVLRALGSWILRFVALKEGMEMPRTRGYCNTYPAAKQRKRESSQIPSRPKQQIEIPVELNRRAFLELPGFSIVMTSCSGCSCHE